jgi:lipid II isoglutaminyl synthase (glutamine-hydrolysing)
MAAALQAKLALARAAGQLSRLRGGGATSLPGKVLLRLDPAAISKLSRRLDHGSVVISATNGKTTTATMAAGILAADGMSLVHNQAGANMAGGVASTLLAATQAPSGLSGAMGLFEVDEFWLDSLVAQLNPRVILLGNLFRDQLDRYGELESIADRWSRATAESADAKLVLNADDPLVADLGRSHVTGEVLYFGVEDDSVALPDMMHAADAKHCRRCGAPYSFQAIYLGHLGRYHCPSCGQTRPEPTISATEIALRGVSSSSFTLNAPGGHTRVELPLPGLYNIYNALAAASMAISLGVPLWRVAAALASTQAAFGRAETIAHDGHRLCILLIKNPAGANEVLRTLVLEPGRHDILGVLNDKIADGRDVSWIWDADFELMAEHIRRFTCSGTRAPELALRLKYAGVPASRIRVQEDLPRALSDALAELPADSSAPLYALPTYTAMLSLRDLLLTTAQRRARWS